MKKLFVLVATVFVVLAARSQGKEIRFHSKNLAGIAGGENPAAATYETINGLSFRSWFTGIGVGVDNYRFRSLPIFIDGCRYLGKGKELFFYGNIGGNLPLGNKSGSDWSNAVGYYYRGGLFAEGGVGYRFPIARETSIVFSLGDSYKGMGAHVAFNNECMSPPCFAFHEYDYRFFRLMAKAGLLF